MKRVFHKSCSCPMCLLGRGRPYSQYIQNQNERKLRRSGRQALAKVVKGENEDAVLGPISSPYTD